MSLAEDSVIGAVLADGSFYDDIEWLRPEMFTRENYSQIWQAIQKTENKDIISIAESSEEMGELFPLLADLAENAITANVEHYATVVRDKYLSDTVKNNLVEVCHKHHGKHDYHGLMSDIDHVVSGAESSGEEQETFNHLIKKTLEGIEERSKSDNAMCGLSSGLTDLDDMVSGFGEGHLVIVAARPKMGKTTFAINTSAHAISIGAGAVVFFSLEMSKDEIMLKFTSNLGRINSAHLRSGKLQDQEWDGLTVAISKMKDKPVHLFAKAGMQLSEIKSQTKRIARKEKIALVVVDYLQLVRVAGASGRLEEVSEVSRQLKELAGAVGAPVMALSQLNRNLEQRTDKRPVPSDLRDSGTIEQDADTMLFPYRDEVYNEDTDQKGVAEIGVVARHGSSGRVRVAADLANTSFKDLAKFY